MKKIFSLIKIIIAMVILFNCFVFSVENKKELIVSAEVLSPNISNSSVLFTPRNAEYIYTGEPISPEFTVRLNFTLEPDIDYTYKIISSDDAEKGTSAGINVGKVTLEIEGTGTFTSGYYGKRTATFKIIKSDEPETENKLVFSPNPKFTEFLENTNRVATVMKTDQGQRILVYSNNEIFSWDTWGNIPYMKMTVPDGWKVTYSTEIESPLPRTITSETVLENAFIYYVLVEETGDVVYTDNEILDWYLSMEIGDDIVLPYPKGDINLNGKVDIEDVKLLGNAILGRDELTSKQAEFADVCEDGIVNCLDLCVLKKIYCYQIKEIGLNP
jgi:hypothetical protein